MSLSLASRLIARMGAKGFFESIPADRWPEVLKDWRVWARPEQIEPPGTWNTWIALAGRGWGKTRTGAEWVRRKAEEGRHPRIALVAPTAADARDVMVEGESGILAVSHARFRPHYEPSKRKLTWPNGVIASLYSAEEPERLRGPQHHLAWADELAAWKYMQEAWDMLSFGLRLGTSPRVLVTTTPKPLALLKSILADPTTVKTGGSTYENRANLSAQFVQKVIRRYEGTRLGGQELHARILDDFPGSLWPWPVLEACRAQMDPTTLLPLLPDMRRIAVAIDPAASAEEFSDETGIIGAGKGIDGHGYLLADYSCKASPEQWAARAIRLYREIDADVMVAEVNNGGDMVEAVIKSVDPSIKVKKVRASRGKVVRAEPIASLYEQKRVHHVGAFPRLEEQMTATTTGGYSGQGSPDRMDAAVWAFTELLGRPTGVFT